MAQCQNMLIASQMIMTTTDTKYKRGRIYRDYLARLVSYEQDKSQKAQLEELGCIHVIGESHSLSAHGVVVRYRKREMRCTAEWIEGCKQWHFGNDKGNQYKHKFELVMARLPRQSTVLLTIGEIDCRPDEGIISVLKKSPDKTLEDIALTTASAYVAYVARIGAQCEHRMIVSGVPATNIQLDTLTAETAKQLVKLIQEFNAILKEEALAAGMDFLDVYALTDRGDGIANGEWHSDNFHLLPTAITEAFGRHCIYFEHTGKAVPHPI